MISTQFKEKIFRPETENFNSSAIAIFRHQAEHSVFYKRYLQTLSVDVNTVSTPTEIVFLPIQFFKTQKILTEQVACFSGAKRLMFESSGTTGQLNSKHFVEDSVMYERSFLTAFKYFYGDITQYCILGLLPSYLERGHSSLVYMVQKLIEKSGHPLSNFYLHNHEELYRHLMKLETEKQKTILIGVTYALLDFSLKFPAALRETIIMETGGMKGRRAEMIREEVHAALRERFNLEKIHAEYGMTELLSQAYADGEGLFRCPPWMKVMVRDVNDPFRVSEYGKGVLNIIDLANIHSCCFIATDDLGEVFTDGRFSVSGRLDLSDLRGCSLMYES